MTLRMQPVLLSVLFALLGTFAFGCTARPDPVDDDDSSGDDDDAADDDDSSGDDDDSAQAVYTSEDIERAGVALPFMGDLLPWEWLVAFAADAASCPSKEDIDVGVSMQLTGGGCVDTAGGVREGIEDVVVASNGDIEYTFTGWSRSATTDPVSYWELNGAVLRLASGEAHVNLELTLQYSGWDSAQRYTFIDVVYDDDDGMGAAALGKVGGEYSASGNLTVNGVGTFVGQLGVTNIGECTEELDLMTLELAGEIETVNLSQTSKSCDGCTDWWSDNHSGSYCH